MTRKELADTLKIYGFKMIKPSFAESDETGALMFYAYTKAGGCVYFFYIEPEIKRAEFQLLSTVIRHTPDDVSYMFFD